MDDLVALLGDLQHLGVTVEVANKLRLVVGRALREAYSEGHVDGQNAADNEDSAVYPRDNGKAWAMSWTNQRMVEMG